MSFVTPSTDTVNRYGGDSLSTATQELPVKERPQAASTRETQSLSDQEKSDLKALTTASVPLRSEA